jgi:splicing suppressor protein 51
MIQHYLETKQTSVDMPTIAPRSTYLPLSSAPSWGYFFTKISDKSMVKDLISPDLKPLVGNDEMASALTAATYKSSRMLTIIAGLELTFPNLATKEDLTLHVIGANAVELDSLMMFEEIIHLLPALRKLHCVFVGIELPNPVDGNSRVLLNCCQNCMNSGRQHSMEMWKGAYHNVVTTSKLPKPDIAVAFHTGSSQTAVELWTPTLKYLVDAGHATIFTTFNEDEMRGETQNFKNLGAKFVVEGQRNKWQAMRPQLEIAEQIENSIYYDHMYWYVIAGRKA